jgi:L-ascorbate metabolism protein UlaG (beta-lactamase superfamily)
MLSAQLYAEQITAKWTGITGLHLSDAKNSIYFDPVITRPSIWDIIFFKNISSNKKLVDRWLASFNIDKTDAIFVSHSHADHSLDTASVANKFNAKVYGTLSTHNIAIGGGMKNKKNLVLIEHGQKHRIGDFVVEVIKLEHNPIIANFQIFSGENNEVLKQPASYASFKMGGAYVFYIMHKKKRIFYHPGALTVYDKSFYRSRRSDHMFLGIASRKSDTDLIENIILPSGAKKVYPMHHDNFFKPLARKVDDLWGVNLEQFIVSSGSRFNIIVPQVGEAILL